MAKKNGNGTEEPLEKQLWKTADKLRKNIDAAEYKHVMLDLPLPFHTIRPWMPKTKCRSFRQ